jgi:hypothetical protein
MRLGTAWFVIILVLLSICVVQGFCLSSRLVSRVALRRNSLADGVDDEPAFDFEFDDEFDAVVTDPMERLKLRHTSLDNTMKAGFRQLAKSRAADRKAMNERFNGVETQISGINGRLDAMQEASDKRDKAQMLVAAALAVWVMVAPKLLEELLASVPHATQ